MEFGVDGVEAIVDFSFHCFHIRIQTNLDVKKGRTPSEESLGCWHRENNRAIGPITCLTRCAKALMFSCASCLRPEHYPGLKGNIT